MPACLRRYFLKTVFTPASLWLLAVFGLPASAQDFTNIPALSFTKQFAGADPLPQVLTVASTSGTLNFTAVVSTAGGGSWLRVDGLGCANTCGATPQVMRVIVTAASTLAAGTYSGQIALTSGSKSLTIPVSLIVAAAGSTFIDNLPGGLSFAAKTGGTSPPSQNLEIRNGGAGTLSWTLTSSTADGGNWLQVSGTSGTAPSIVNVSVVASALPNGGIVAGTFLGRIKVDGASTSVTVPISVTIGTSILQQINGLQFSKVFAGQNPLPQILNVSSNGSSVNFTATVSTATGGNWLSIDGLGCADTCGATPQVVRVLVQPVVTLAAGTYTGEVVFSSGKQAVTVPVNLTVVASGANYLTNQPGETSFSLKTGGSAPPVQTFEIRNAASDVLNWTAASSTSDSGNWLSISAVNGTTPGLLTLGITPANLPNGGLIAGTFVGQVLIRTAGSAITIPVSVTVGDNVLSQIHGLSFNKPLNGADPLPQTLTVASTGTATNFTTTVSTATGGDWLSVDGLGCANTCGATPQVVRVLVNAAVTLPAGTYSGEVVFSTTKESMTVPVTLTVGNPAGPFFDNIPGQVSFFVKTGTGNPPSQSVQIRNGGAGALDWTVTATTSDSNNWLTVSPASGTAPSNIAIGIVTSTLPNAGLVAGSFTGHLVFRGAGTSVTIPVSVTVGDPIFNQLDPVTFTKPFGGSNPLPQNVTATSTGTAFTFFVYPSAGTGGSWLSVSGLGCANTCGATPQVFTIRAAPAATLPVGTYTGQVMLSSTKMAMTIPVTLTVTGQQTVPGTPVLTFPANAATGVSTSPILTWNAATNADSYDVAFGASTSPPVVTNTTSTSYSPGALTAGTTYYWRITAKNSAGSTPSGIASFTTAGGAQSTLSILASSAVYNTYSAFTVSAGSTTVQTRNITLSSSAGAVAYNSGVTGGPVFVSVAPPNGTTPAAITLNIYPGSLGQGTYTNTISFSGGGATAFYTVSLTVQPSGGVPTSRVGIYRASAGLILSDRNGDGGCCSGDLVGVIGQTGDVPLYGDWNGAGSKKFGLYRPSSGLFLLDMNDNGAFDSGDKALFFAAQAGDVPVMGDWTGTGVDRAGVFRGANGTWYLDVNGDGSFVGRAFLGQSGDIPIVGNWNGVGRQSKIGIYRPTAQNGQPGNFFLVDSNGDGQYTGADQPLFFFGQTGDIPILGDWNGDGRTKVGIFRPAGSANGAGLIILDYNGNFAWDGPSTDKVQYFAPFLTGPSDVTTVQPGDIPIVGNWITSYSGPNTLNVTGRTRTGVYRPSTGTFFLDVSADGTFQGRAYVGQSGDVPLGAPVIAGGTVVSVN